MIRQATRCHRHRCAPPPRSTPVTFLQHSPAWKFGRARSSLCSGIRKYAVALTLVTVAISVTGQRSGPRSLTTQANCCSMIERTKIMLIFYYCNLNYNIFLVIRKIKFRICKESMICYSIISRTKIMITHFYYCKYEYFIFLVIRNMKVEICKESMI